MTAGRLELLWPVSSEKKKPIFGSINLYDNVNCTKFKLSIIHPKIVFTIELLTPEFVEEDPNEVVLAREVLGTGTADDARADTVGVAAGKEF